VTRGVGCTLLPEALEQLLRQSFRDIEINAVDDSSTDSDRAGGPVLKPVQLYKCVVFI